MCLEGVSRGSEWESEGTTCTEVDGLSLVDVAVCSVWHSQRGGARSMSEHRETYKSSGSPPYLRHWKA